MSHGDGSVRARHTPRRPDAPACNHFHRRGLPACFHVGGIDPRSAAPQYEHATLDDLLSALFSTPPDDPETVIERMEAEPYTLEQARAIKTRLGKLANGDQRIAEVAFKSIREAAEKARCSLQWDCQDKLPKPPRQLMTELARTGKSGPLSKNADGVLLNALLYGAVSAGGIDDEEGDKPKSLNRLRQLPSADLSRAASAARDKQGILHHRMGRRHRPAHDCCRAGRRLVTEARACRDAEIATRRAEAAERAAELLLHSRPADQRHGYLVAKRIQPHGAQQFGDRLLIPVDVAGALTSLQIIGPNGSKRFLVGVRIAGGYNVIDDQTTRSEIILAEGFATGATLHERASATVWCAFSAGNLAAVARYARSLHPAAALVIAADEDQFTPGNPGITAATAAALAVGGRLLAPTGLDLSDHPTDWNDWFRLRDAAVEVARG